LLKIQPVAAFVPTPRFMLIMNDSGFIALVSTHSAPKSHSVIVLSQPLRRLSSFPYISRPPRIAIEVAA